MNPSRESQGAGIYAGATSYADEDFGRFLRGAFLASAGLDATSVNRPIVGITNIASDFVPCHRSVPELVRAVERGVREAGGLPMVFPVPVPGEIFTSPTSMLYRNLAAMQVEEQIASQPMDCVVVVGGCDKTLPAYLMAATSAGVPAVAVVVGPMSPGQWRGERVSACTDCRRVWADYRRGALAESDLDEVQEQLCATAGTCGVMGTASTMACVAEAMGLLLPGAATAPAVSGERLRLAAQTGRLAVRTARRRTAPAHFLRRRSLLNGLRVLAAIGGSTNAVVHLLAIARRAGVGLDLAEVEQVFASTPMLVDCKPSGQYFAEDFHHAGGVPLVMARLRHLLDLDAPTIEGGILEERLREVRDDGDRTVIRSPEAPCHGPGALAVLHGNLAPRGALIKSSAATEELLVHRGPAVVFEGAEDVERRIDDPALGITPDSVLIIRNLGPVGAGMPEAAAVPIPRYLARAGIRDMVRVSDGRMSGTSGGTVVLHCAPEAAVGGPLALVVDGDEIVLDVPQRRLQLLVSDADLASRRAAWRPPALPARGWRRLAAQNVGQADLGADLDFLSRVPFDDPELTSEEER